MFGVDAIVTQHFKMFFRDMNNQSFDEIESRNTLLNGFIVFVASVMECNIFPIIFINAGSGDDRTPKVSADIFDCDVRSTKVRFGPNIKTICMIL